MQHKTISCSSFAATSAAIHAFWNLSMHAAQDKHSCTTTAVCFVAAAQNKQLQQFLSILCSHPCRLEFKHACSTRQAFLHASCCVFCRCSTKQTAAAVLQHPLQLSMPSRI